MLINRKCAGDIFEVRRKFISAYSTTTLPKEEKNKIGKWDVNYLKVGNGKHNMLCLPGALGTIWTDFKPQIDGFDNEKFTLVAWDPPGYGKSRPPDKEFTADFYEKDADYAYEFMMALNIPKYSVLGWSDGGTTSFILAAKYPQVMKKMVAFATNSFILPNELEWYKNYFSQILVQTQTEQVQSQDYFSPNLPQTQTEQDHSQVSDHANESRAQWTRFRILTLIESFKEHKNVFKSTTVRNIDAWQRIAADFGEMTAKQCERNLNI